METQTKLEHEVSLRWLLLFALPTILSSIFANLYSTVDGIFVARWVDTNALSAINITMPMIFLASALGMMFGTGGNALVAKKLGEGNGQEAREDFSLLMVVAFVFSVMLAILCFVFLDPLCRFLGSDDALLPYCRAYMIPVLVSVPFAVFGMVFQLSFITVGRAGLGAALSVILSFCRTILFMVLPVLVLPRFFEMDGVWMSLAAGEILSITMSIYYFVKYRAVRREPKAAAAD